MRSRIIFFAIFLPAFLFAQKSYLVHLTIDKVSLGDDSVVYKNGKTFLFEITNRSDTIEVAKPGGIPVAIVIDIKKAMERKQMKYEIGYAYFKKINGKWELIRHFGYTERYQLLSPKPGFETTAKKKSATEEYHCMIGQPAEFEAFFRMDVYKK